MATPTRKHPRMMGKVKTSMPEMTRATPKTAASQTSTIRGNFPIGFGLGGGKKAKASSKPAGGRRRMY